MPHHIVVLGAGFGGLELVTRLSESVSDKAQITLIDKNDAFMFGFSKLDIMFGRRQASDVWHSYRDMAKSGVEFRQETVMSIDPARRRVVEDCSYPRRLFGLILEITEPDRGLRLLQPGPLPIRLAARGQVADGGDGLDPVAGFEGAEADLRRELGAMETG